MKKFTVCIVINLALVVDLMAEEETSQTLETTVVTATRYGKDAALVNSQVSIFDSEDLRLFQPRTLDDIFRYQPGVEFSGGPRQTGQQLEIRGEGGSAVTVRIDGARQNFASGHSGQRFFVDPELLSRGETLRGSGSHLYGSGGAGVVSLNTWSVDDFLGGDLGGGIETAGRVKTAYSSGNDEMVYSGVGVVQQGAWDFLASVIYRDAGDVRLANGLDSVGSAIEVTNYLFKAGYNVDLDQRIEFTYSNYESKDSNGANPQNEEGISNALVDRETSHQQFTLSHSFSPESNQWLDLKSLLYWNETEQSRIYQAASGSNLGRENRHELSTLGLEIVNHSRYEAWNAEHNLITGFEIYRDDQTGRETRDDFYAPGKVGSSSGRPNADAQTYAFFAQNDTSWSNGISGALGLRYDHASSSSDGGRSQSDSQFSPNVEVRYEALDGLAIFSSFSQAFTAPTLNEIYQNGSHYGVVPISFFPAGYYEEVFVSNEDLEAQSSQNVEIGVDFTKDLHDAKLTSRVVWYRKKGEDTLDTEIVGTVVTPSYPGFMGPGTLVQDQRQTVNRDETVIQGWEATLRYDASNWYANGSFSALSGEDKSTGDDLNTIPGDKLALECGYFVNEDITVGARGLWVSSREDKVQDNRLKTSGYDTYGIFADWQVSENFTLTTGVHNLLDQEYERTSIAQSEPGRSCYISATYNF
ncbi:MAG: hemoglobin/transferrin/lactoferrin receptor protein [Crocinitomicaceae bacterium]|jgi:hemoglobin/transferrin/lactoferrin receptor protein